MSVLKRGVRQFLRPAGWELRQFDPDLSLDTYLWMLFEHYGINCVLDVGARHGDYGLLLRNNNFRGFIASFEPVSANFQILQKQCEADPAWEAHQLALGSRADKLEINVGKGTNFSSFLRPSSYGLDATPDIASERTELVSVRRLDEVFAEITRHIPNPRVYLKLDTQGFDMEVVRGAQGCLSQVVALQTELSLQPLYEDMTTNWISALEELKEAGYEVSALFAGYRDQKLRLSEMDCVMVRNDA